MDTYSFTYSVVNNRVTVLFPNDEFNVPRIIIYKIKRPGTQ